MFRRYLGAGDPSTAASPCVPAQTPDALVAGFLAGADAGPGTRDTRPHLPVRHIGMGHARQRIAALRHLYRTTSTRIVALT